MMEVLNAVNEQDLDMALPLDDEEGGQEAVAGADKGVPAVDLDELEARATERVLNRLAKMSEVATPKQTSHLAQTVKELQEEGVPAVAIERLLKLREAERKDEEIRLREQAQMQAAQTYEEKCWDTVFSALEEVSEAIPQIKNGRPALRQSLAEDVKNLVWGDKRFADVQKAYQSGQPLPKARLKEAAAAVADGFLKELGVTKPSGGIDIRSSKPSKSDSASANFDPDTLPRNLRFIYDINMTHFNDPKKAAQRVREAMRKGE